MSDTSAQTNKEKEVYEKLREVTDPEFGQSVVEKNLIDTVKVEEGSAEVTYHLTVPFCPMAFALYIGRQIRKKASEVAGIERVTVKVKDHLQTDIINNILEKEG